MPSPRGIVREASGTIPASAGIGLRFQHHRAMLDQRPRIGWLEVHPENYMGGGRPLEYLTALRRDYPISLHGVGLSLGTAEDLDAAHLERTRRLIERIEPGLVSEHLSWSIAGGTYFADLLPLPMTEEALTVVCRHVDEVQAYFGRRILVENPSSYLRYRHSTIPEWEFLAAVARRTGCGLLCDVNNIYVSAWNHGFDALMYLNALPADRISEIHLAGHTARTLDDGRVLRIDDHGSRVPQPVWDLYDATLARFGRVPTLIEWDTNVPELETLVSEAVEADRRLAALSNGTADADAA
jgi:uncharacterized protein (UPF0276 family)